MYSVSKNKKENERRDRDQVTHREKKETVGRQTNRKTEREGEKRDRRQEERMGGGVGERGENQEIAFLHIFSVAISQSQ